MLFMIPDAFFPIFHQSCFCKLSGTWFEETRDVVNRQEARSVKLFVCTGESGVGALDTKDVWENLGKPDVMTSQMK